MDDTSRDGEETMFDFIHSPSPDNEPEVDGLQYLNNSSEGMIFDEDERIDEGHNNDDEGNVVLQITKTGEVYYIRHLVIITCFN